MTSKHEMNWQVVALVTIALALCGLVGATVGLAHNTYRIAESMKPCVTSGENK